MKKHFLLIASILAGFTPFASAKMAQAPIPPEIEDEQNQGINKQPWHATLMPYASLKEALAAKRHNSSFCRSLNGMWKFHWVPRPEQRPLDFYKPEFDAKSWKEISVPSNWQVLGYGTPFYRNNGYTIQKDPPRVMTEPPQNFTAFKERNPVGSYRREFAVPLDWKGRRIFISFDGVDSGFFLWVNGQKVGYSINSRNVAEFDLTPYVKPGQKNLLAAEVYCYTAGTYFEDQDMWRLSGIFRNVTLWSSPQVHIRDFAVGQKLDDKYQDATLTVKAKVRNFADQAAPERKLAIQLYDAAGKPVSGAKAEALVPKLNAGEEKAIQLQAKVSRPKHWTAETPNLYTTILTLDGDPEILSARTGFRKIEIKGRVFLINGVPVKFLGANRHEHWADTGHYVSEERMIRDLEVLKQANCNHVRTSHYTNDPRWYELCDEWGIYLVAEANVECHGLARVLDRDPRWEKMIVDRNIANVENCKNHPSVILWSMGNENGGGSNFVSAVKAVKELDPTRPTHYEAFSRGADNPADVDSQMYGTAAGIEAVAKDDQKYTKPFYMCEYAHAMNNSMGSLDTYVEVFNKYPSMLGGAIWEWQDQGLWNRRDPKRQYLAYGGGFGEFPHNDFFIHKGVVFHDRSPKPHFPEVKKLYQWIGFTAEDLSAGKVRIRNKYQFITLGDLKGSWTVSEDGKVIDQGKMESLDLAPLSETALSIPFKPIKAKPGAEYFLRISYALGKNERWAKAGYETAWEQFKLPISVPAQPVDVAKAKPVELEENDQSITVRGNGFAVVFNKATGAISQIQNQGANLVLPGGGPKLHLWRALHHSDDHWLRKDWSRSGIKELKFTPVSLRAEQTGPSAVRITSVVQAEGKNRFSVTHSAAYTVLGDGSIIVDNSLVPHGSRIALARVGVRMLLDPKLDRFTYLGRGPMENYADRLRGSDVGLYATTVRENMTGYAKPMECGNHEEVRWAALTNSKGGGLMAQANQSLLQVGALPYTDEELDAAAYTVDLPKSTATVMTLGSKTLGVGSNSCGPRPLAPFIVESEAAAFSYVLRIVPGIKANLPALGRLVVPQNRVQPVVVSRNQFGTVSLTSQTSNAKIEYSMDGKTWTPYAAPFEVKEAVRMEVRAVSGALLPWKGTVEWPKYDARAAWKITASSSARGEGEAGNAIDNDPATFWHSQWQPTPVEPPHHLILDLGKIQSVSAITCTARSGNPNGFIKNYELYASKDGKNWGEPLCQATLEQTATQTIQLPQRMETKYLKFVALSNHRGEKFVSLAELDILP